MSVINQKTQDFIKKYERSGTLNLVLIIALAVSHIAWFYAYDMKDKESRNRVFAMTPSGTFEMVSRTDNSREQVEIENFTKVFMSKMYAHTAQTYTEDLNTALQLISAEDGATIVEAFAAQNVENQYKTLNATTDVTIDKVQVDMSTIP